MVEPPWSQRQENLWWRITWTLCLPTDIPIWRSIVLFLLLEAIRPSIPLAVPPSLFFILTVQCTEERA